jgi:hypothetical protein
MKWKNIIWKLHNFFVVYSIHNYSQHIDLWDEITDTRQRNPNDLKTDMKCSKKRSWILMTETKVGNKTKSI